MASFIARLFGFGGGEKSSTPAPSSEPARPTTQKPTSPAVAQAKTRSRYAGLLKNKRDEAEIAKKKLLGQ